MALSQFQNARIGGDVKDNQFYTAGGNLTVNNNPDPVTSILRHFVATGATFDSAERYPPGKCHPSTRKRITEQIMNWIYDPDTTQYIIWLYGPAGSGKSALAQSICERLAQIRPERKGGSFFFANGHPDRGNAFKLFSTISYQLAIHFPSVRAEINDALTHDPTLPTKSMEIQLQSLIIEPLLRSKDIPSPRPVVIIDGLDECVDDEEAITQRNIVSLIARSIVIANRHDKLPIRFFVASRPEYWIRDAFNTSPLPTITLSLSLLNELDANQDIRIYLTEEFEKIRLKNPRILESVKLPWPPKQVVDHFVYEASGQFIYASTVIRFVGKSSRFSNPLEQLRIITSPGPHRAVAFSELDRLYTRILYAYPRWETMKRVLGGLLVYPYPTIVKVFLDVDPNDIALVLDALSSLIDVREACSTDAMLRELSKFASSGLTEQDTISFCHLSFLEFLRDETRSGTYHIDVDAFRDEITQSLFTMIHRSLDEGYRSDRYLDWNIDFATYHWIVYKVAIESLNKSQIDLLQSLIPHMTERLLLLIEFHGRSKEFLVRFGEDMRVLDSAIQDTNLNLKAFRFEDQQIKDSEKANEILISLRKFQDVVSQAQERAMHALTLCVEVTVTPALVYAAEFHRGKECILSDKPLAIVSDSTDNPSTIEQYRHLIHLSYFSSSWTWRVNPAVFEALLTKGHSTYLRIQDSDEWNLWKAQRAFLTYRLLNLVFGVNPLSLTGSPPNEWREYCLILKECFFDSKSMTDICGRGNLRKACECSSLLRFIRDPHSERAMQIWRWENIHRHVPNFITSVICWLNRQLAKPQNLRLVQDHDKSLPQKMAATTNYLFGKFFLQDFSQSYTSHLYAREYSSRPGEHFKAIGLKALPLPRGIIIEDNFTFGLEDWQSETLNWHTFHDEVFGKMNGSGESVTSPTIDPSCWHPHLGFRLLNALVKFLYGQVYPTFSISNSWNEQGKLKFQKSLAYIPECLPFTHPLSENLRALRLIVYLYPHLVDNSTVTSFLPHGIWPAMAAFLQRFPLSLLSSEELGLFERWLSSPDHLDISEYVAISQTGTEPDLPSAETSAVNHPGKRPRALTNIPGQNTLSVSSEEARKKRARRDDDSNCPSMAEPPQ